MVASAVVLLGMPPDQLPIVPQPPEVPVFQMDEVIDVYPCCSVGIGSQRRVYPSPSHFCVKDLTASDDEIKK
jgi:hypothetical protein